MPAVSLVVCVCQQRDLLARRICKSQGFYDELLVVHDRSDTTDVWTVVAPARGRYVERSHEFQQGPHWPFVWDKPTHDWILRLDADEFPTAELKTWLKKFRSSAKPDETISFFEDRYWPGAKNSCHV